jgi:hypothetical protein
MHDCRPCAPVRPRATDINIHNFNERGRIGKRVSSLAVRRGREPVHAVHSDRHDCVAAMLFDDCCRSSWRSAAPTEPMALTMGFESESCRAAGHRRARRPIFIWQQRIDAETIRLSAARKSQKRRMVCTVVVRWDAQPASESPVLTRIRRPSRNPERRHDSLIRHQDRWGHLNDGTDPGAKVDYNATGRTIKSGV